MMSNEGYQDRILTCRDCGQEFTFSSGEQEFFASRGLTNTPGRCPACRAARRGGSQSFSPRAPRGDREYYETTCATCGRSTSVPFVPREDRPVYCSDCFQAQRASRGSRRDDASSSNYSYGSGGSSNYGGGRDRGHGRDRDRGGRDSRDRREYRDRW